MGFLMSDAMPLDALLGSHHLDAARSHRLGVRGGCRTRPLRVRGGRPNRVTSASYEAAGSTTAVGRRTVNVDPCP